MIERTHWDDCWKSGPAHYECAVTAIEQLLNTLLNLRYCNVEAAERAEKAEAERDALRERTDRAEAELAVLRNNQLGPVPEGPLKALGAWVADHTDDDTWPDAERYLNAALAEMETMRTEWRDLLTRAEKAEAEAGEWKGRAERAEDALLRKGYRLSCDIVACNCGDQWAHGGHAEMRLTEIQEALEQAVARRNGQTILADVVHALACRERAEKAEAELEALRADAERYRWLRSAMDADISVVQGFGVVDVGSTGVAATYEEALFLDKLDAAIDAARGGEG